MQPKPKTLCLALARIGYYLPAALRPTHTPVGMVKWISEGKRHV